jgi:membrane protein DedA with SNARE-associated domain
MKKIKTLLQKWFRREAIVQTIVVIILIITLILEVVVVVRDISITREYKGIMNIVTQFIIPYLLLYKYWALFGLTFVAAFFFPIPPGTIIMASAAFAHQGYLSILWVIVFSILGNIAGDNAGYWLARKYGRSVLSRIGFAKILDSARYKKVEMSIIKRPGFFVFISRFEVFTNLAVNLIAGLGNMSYQKYLLFEVFGEIFQVGLYGAIGYVFGGNWQELSSLIGRSLLVIILIVVVSVMIVRKRTAHA